MSKPLFNEEVLYSNQGHRRTRSLFWETAVAGDNPVMSLRRSKKFLLLRPLFIEFVTNDPTELLFAEYVFGDYSYWKNITEAKWMDKYLDEWRMVTDTKRKAMAFEAVLQEARDKGRSAFSAAKFLIEEPWKNKRDKKTKRAVQQSADAARSGLNADIARMKDYK